MGNAQGINSKHPKLTGQRIEAGTTCSLANLRVTNWFSLNLARLLLVSVSFFQGWSNFKSRGQRKSTNLKKTN